MISCLAIVNKGKAKEVPQRMKLTEEEFKRIQEQLQLQVDSSRQDLEEAQKDSEMEQDVPEKEEKPSGNDADKDIRDLYNLDDYDEETPQTVSLFSSDLQYYSNNEEDPYIQIGEDSEEEELRIESTDNLVLCCKTEDEVSHLEVYVYEEEEDNLYVHHDIMLPSFPLCLEWLDYKSGGVGNYVAIGTFDPQIEIWDLDMVDAVFPDVVLGQIPTGNTVSTKKKHGPARVAKRTQKERHVDAVMSISWNKEHRNLLASGSADATIKLWDLNRPTEAVMSFDHHKDKVQAVQWNPKETTALLSGGYDRKAIAFDSRTPQTIREWKLTADVEVVKWDPFLAERFYVSSEDGVVQCFDVRNTKPIWTLHAHDGAASALDVSVTMQGFIVTGGADKQVKVWTTRNDKPKCLASRDLDAVYTCLCRANCLM
jgi:periodic tryptophan protein 1